MAITTNVRNCQKSDIQEDMYIGVDPRKKNLITMTNTSGISTHADKEGFKGKLPRHLRVLEKEKAETETDGLLQAERDLSKH